MRTFPGARAGFLPGSSAGGGGERAARGGDARCTWGDTVAVHALILGGARSGKSALAEERALSLGDGNVLYVATAIARFDDPNLAQRIQAHRESRPYTWGLLELGGGNLDPVFGSADGWSVVLVDSLTLWVSARMLDEDESETLEEFERFLEHASKRPEPVILVSDEVGLGVVPESTEGQRFRDLLGLVNQRAAAAAEEVYVCIAGIAQRIK